MQPEAGKVTVFRIKKALVITRARIGGGGGTADPYLSEWAGLYLHPQIGVRVKFNKQILL